mmetsp:Transcript_17686/g.36965  ORF Transcript_17686/g.36965 Transcript_17686/m.36965 type:complete len:227 (-) Transcript_17686:264-944(-)
MSTTITPVVSNTVVSKPVVTTAIAVRVAAVLGEGSGVGDGRLVAVGHARQEFLCFPHEFLFLQEQIELALDQMQWQSLRWVVPPGLGQENGVFGRHGSTSTITSTSIVVGEHHVRARANSLLADQGLVRVGGHVFVGLLLRQDFVGNNAPGINVAFQSVRAVQAHFRCHVPQSTDRSGHVKERGVVVVAVVVVCVVLGGTGWLLLMLMLMLMLLLFGDSSGSGSTT